MTKKAVFSTILAIVIALAIGTLVYLNKGKLDHFFGVNTEVVTMKPDTIKIQAVTINDVLHQRDSIKELRRVDSVFIHLHDVTLTAILMKIGPDKANSYSIVREYDSNRLYYDAINIGGNIQRNLDGGGDLVPLPQRDSLLKK